MSLLCLTSDTEVCRRRLLPATALERVFFPSAAELIAYFSSSSLPKGACDRPDRSMTVLKDPNSRSWGCSSVAISDRKSPKQLCGLLPRARATAGRFGRCYTRPRRYPEGTNTSACRTFRDIFTESVLWLPCVVRFVSCAYAHAWASAQARLASDPHSTMVVALASAR